MRRETSIHTSLHYCIPSSTVPMSKCTQLTDCCGTAFSTTTSAAITKQQHEQTNKLP